MIAISVVIAPRAARVVRASVLAIREFVYVESARALGVSHARVAWRHILPNTFGPFIVLVTAQLGGAILAEAALSFLGLGVPEPYPSWGRMLSIAAAEYAQKAPVAGDLSGAGHQPRGVRHEPARRRAPRHAGSAPARVLITARGLSGTRAGDPRRARRTPSR